MNALCILHDLLACSTYSNLIEEILVLTTEVSSSRLRILAKAIALKVCACNGKIFIVARSRKPVVYVYVAIESLLRSVFYVKKSVFIQFNGGSTVTLESVLLSFLAHLYILQV